MIEHNTSVVFPAAPLLTVILALIGIESASALFSNNNFCLFSKAWKQLCRSFSMMPQQVIKYAFSSTLIFFCRSLYNFKYRSKYRL